jgi:hypothetical protein
VHTVEGRVGPRGGVDKAKTMNFVPEGNRAPDFSPTISFISNMFQRLAAEGQQPNVTLDPP